MTDRSRGAEYTKHTIQTDRPIDVVELRAAGNESYPITQCSANRSETKNWTILMKAVPQPHTRLTATDAVDVVTAAAAAAARDARPWTPGALQTQRSCGFILPMAAVGLLAACACWRESRRSALAIANSWHNALCLRSGNSGSSQSTMYIVSYKFAPASFAVHHFLSQLQKPVTVGESVQSQTYTQSCFLNQLKK